jgi:RNA polymerase sigma-70 factor (ECF subfamily)
VRECLAGSQEACTRLVGAYERMVGTLIWRATGNESVIEDLAQETFLRVFRALSYFDSRAKLSTWIYTIAHRVAIDHLRSAGRWRNESFSDSDAASEARVVSQRVASALNPEAALSQLEITRLVQSGLSRLPEKYRIPLVYAAIDELDYATIASMLDVPIGTVKTLVYRGKQMLKETILDAM